MIYLASDDSYFALGVEAIFSAINKEITLIRINLDEESVLIPYFSCEDTVILAVEHTGILTRLLCSARTCGIKTLLIMDNLSEKTMENINIWSPGIRSKKMRSALLPQFLDAGSVYLKDLSLLTPREINIMGSLVSGKTPYGIAMELNLSVKTIFSYKLSALKKLGLNHLNARSLLIFGRIFQGLVSL